MGYSVDLELSKKYAEKIEAEPRECYSNSIKALIVIEDDFPQAVYCEGYATTESLQGIPIHHGWIEIKTDDKTVIIDVTWCNKSETLVYKPLMKLTSQNISRMFKRRSRLKTPLSDFYNRELIDEDLFKKMSSTEFVEMMNSFYEEFNTALKTVKTVVK